DELVLDRRPERGGQVGAGGGGALLPLVLEGTADERGHDRGGVGRGVDDHEVLAAGLADKARIVAKYLDILAYGAPEVLEGTGRPGEVDAGQVGMGQRHAGDRLAVPGHHV